MLYQGESSGEVPLDRIVFAAPSGGANEYSNLSSAGSISDREQPETPGRLAIIYYLFVYLFVVILCMIISLAYH